MVQVLCWYVDIAGLGGASGVVVVVSVTVVRGVDHGVRYVEIRAMRVVFDVMDGVGVERVGGLCWCW